MIMKKHIQYLREEEAKSCKVPRQIPLSLNAKAWKESEWMSNGVTQ